MQISVTHVTTVIHYLLHTFPGRRHRERARDFALSSRFGSTHHFSEIRMGNILSLFTIRLRTVLDDASLFCWGFTPAVTT